MVPYTNDGDGCDSQRGRFHTRTLPGCWHRTRILAIIETKYQTTYSGIMKTTVDIPDEQLRELVKFTRAKTKREAIVTAIADFNQRRRMAALVKHSGTFGSLLTNEELEASEAGEPHPRRRS
jgi:hypothetical protein